MAIGRFLHICQMTNHFSKWSTAMAMHQCLSIAGAKQTLDFLSCGLNNYVRAPLTPFLLSSLALQTLYPKSRGKESGDLRSPNPFLPAVCHLVNIIMVLLLVISSAEA